MAQDLGQPNATGELKARYASMLHGALSKENVLNTFDAMVAETAAAAKRDDRKWQTQYRAYFQSNRNDDFHDAAGEAAYARAFIDRRWTDLSKISP